MDKVKQDWWRGSGGGIRGLRKMLDVARDNYLRQRLGERRDTQGHLVGGRRMAGRGRQHEKWLETGGEGNWEKRIMAERDRVGERFLKFICIFLSNKHLTSSYLMRITCFFVDKTHLRADSKTKPWNYKSVFTAVLFKLCPVDDIQNWWNNI